MKKIVFALMTFGSLAIVSCSDDDSAPIIEPPVATCNDGILNNGETEIDCGGPNCAACVEEPPVVATCNDGILNGDETEIDFGGSCAGEITVTGLIAEDTTWTRNNIYLLGGKVVVGVGVTLTIEPGTIIKGLPGTGSLASALIVQRDSKINAVGTPERPIIFTSSQDNIKVGETAGTNLDQTDNGLWGGVLVLGNAPASLSGDAAQTQIEGIPASDAFGLYGGNDPADDSGDLAYISIRHGGAIIGEANEINGLTLGGVGTGTSIDNIEIVGNEDDGLEIFGGSVNVTNVFVWAVADDALDFDQAWTGTIDNAVVVQGVRSDSALELDGPEGSATGSYTLNNITIFGNTETGEGLGNRRIADFRDGLLASINNVYVTGFLPTTSIRLNGDKSATTYNDGLLTLSNWQIVLPEGVAAVNELFTTSNVTLPTTYVADGSTIATAVTAGSQTVGADTAAFSWTYSNTKASLGF
ncbi:hypothetical protein U1E44_13705 [Arenibacter sp. GZD96]|uniref:hypothetical protein n=1 Tax=Aurantibrevibacter litoralis TaxID=3106030 RepID=UPI002AFE0F99|nr:hypothetical protein [Arenibacter sp. GZD-96]MEA1787151.1 hypothetical protein [Arenibacter sp. GZD-96]